MFSQDGEVGAGTLDAHLDDVDAFVSAASKTLRFGLRVALYVVRFAPIFLFFRTRTLERLNVDDRVALLSRLERSSFAALSLAFIGWRSVMTLVFYESPTELKRLGYASDERHVYKRRLPTLAAASVVPLPLESGTRLRDERSPDSTDADAVDSAAPSPAAPNSNRREVA